MTGHLTDPMSIGVTVEISSNDTKPFYWIVCNEYFLAVLVNSLNIFDSVHFLNIILPLFCNFV